MAPELCFKCKEKFLDDEGYHIHPKCNHKVHVRCLYSSYRCLCVYYSCINRDWRNLISNSVNDWTGIFNSNGHSQLYNWNQNN